MNKNIIILLFAIIFHTSTSTVLASDSQKNIMAIEHQIGHSLILKLREVLIQAESMTIGLAIKGQDIHQVEQIKNYIPYMIDQYPEKGIAGGGVWYEPYVIQPHQYRYSYFWAKNPQHQFIFIPDYNKDGPIYNEQQFQNDEDYKKTFLKSPGYHNEEWYALAKYSPHSKGGLWSQSYTDPYSLEPMVTYSVPIKKADQTFIGVATIDVKLQFLFNLCKEWGNLISGKVFILDRNDKIISFFDQDHSRIIIHDESNNSIRDEYLFFNKIVEIIPDYKPIFESLQKFDKEIKDLSKRSSYFHLAKNINEQSYAINEEESQKIISYYEYMKEYRGNSKDISQLGGIIFNEIFLEKDPYLKKPSSALIYIVPKTLWKVIIIFPSHLLNLLKIKNHFISYPIIIFLIFFISFLLVIWVLWQKKEIKKRNVKIP